MDKRTYTVNDDYFSHINEISSYILGFIAADGHVTNYQRKSNYLIINLIHTDIEILNLIKNELSYTGKIYSQKKSNGQDQCALRICSNKIALDIKNYIITNNKTFDLKWVKNIDEKFLKCFIRGYFDGDGSLSFNIEKGNYSASFVGTRLFLEGLLSFYRAENNTNDGSIKEYKTYSQLTFGGKYCARSFLNWLYEDSTINTRLSRKYDKYLEFINYVGNEDKPYNNQILNKELVETIRSSNHKKIKDLAEEFSLNQSTIYDVLSNKTWHDESYKFHKKNSDLILIEYMNETKTLTEWSKYFNIPKSTIDRRLRKNLSLEEVFSQDKLKPIQINKDRFEDSKNLANIVRNDYKNGLIGKSNYEKNCIKKSRYIDIIGNRIFKEKETWWKQIS
jgi:hypothetical protein